MGLSGWPTPFWNTFSHHLVFLLSSHLAFCSRIPWAWIEVTTRHHLYPCSRRHTLAMGSVCPQAWRLLASGVEGFLVLSSLTHQGLADPNMCSSVHTLCLLSAGPNLLLSFSTLVAVCGGYSHSINIEIPLDACSLGGDAFHVCLCAMALQKTQAVTSHTMAHPLPGPELCAKSPSSFQLVLFSPEN